MIAGRPRTRPATLDFLEGEIKSAEQRLVAIMKVSAEADLLKTLPCVGTILGMVLKLVPEAKSGVRGAPEKKSEATGGDAQSPRYEPIPLPPPSDEAC